MDKRNTGKKATATDKLMEYAKAIGYALILAYHQDLFIRHSRYHRAR